MHEDDMLEREAEDMQGARKSSGSVSKMRFIGKKGASKDTISPGSVTSRIEYTDSGTSCSEAQRSSDGIPN